MEESSASGGVLARLIACLFLFLGEFGERTAWVTVVVVPPVMYISIINKHDFINSPEEMNLMSEIVWSYRHSGICGYSANTYLEPLAKSHKPMGPGVPSVN